MDNTKLYGPIVHSNLNRSLACTQCTLKVDTQLIYFSFFEKIQSCY